MKQNILPLILLALVCAGCPATLKPETMTAQTVILDHEGTADVLVTTFGATDISKAKPIRLTDEGYAQALRSSLERSRVFRRALTDSPGHYQLQATVIQLDEDVFGIDMTASIAVKYVLARTSPKELVWEKTIASSHTSTMRDSVIQITRLERALEGAARKNIGDLIQELALLKLQ